MPDDQYTHEDSLFTRQLRAFKDHGEPVRIYLSNGVGLSGHLIDFDNDTVLMEAERGYMPLMLNRDGILSVMLASVHQPTSRRGAYVPETVVA